MACHGVSNKLLGPSFREVAARYKAQDGAPARLAAKLRAGSEGTWGPIPMPPQQLPDADVDALVKWVLEGAP